MSSNAAAALSQAKPGDATLDGKKSLASIRRIIALMTLLGSKKVRAAEIGTPPVIEAQPKAEPDDSDVLDLAEVATRFPQPTSR